MPMRAGSLRYRVQLQTVTETRDAAGGLVESWATTATLSAAVEPITGREWFTSRADQAEVTTRIRLRYRAGVVPKQRIVWGARTYDIVSVIDPDQRHRELVLMCTEVQ